MTVLEECLLKLRVISTALQLRLIDQNRAAGLLDEVIAQMVVDIRKENMWP